MYDDSLTEAATSHVGTYGERIAVSFLKSKGYRPLVRNYKAEWGDRKDQRGEIDLVCRHDQTLVFVEVKTRDASTLMRPAEAVNAHKKRKMIRTAYQYVRELVRPPEHARFDIVEVYLEAMKPPRCTCIPSAFGVDQILRYRRV